MCNLTMSQQFDKSVIVSKISQRDVKEGNTLFLLYIIKKSLNIQKTLSSGSETKSRGCLLTWTTMKQHPQQMVQHKYQRS